MANTVAGKGGGIQVALPISGGWYAVVWRGGLQGLRHASRQGTPVVPYLRENKA